MPARRLRILHVTRETAGDRRFGIGRSLLPVTEALRARGHEVRYLTQEDLTPRSRTFVPQLAHHLAQATGPLYGDAARVSALAWAERLNIGRLAAKLGAHEGWNVVHLHDPWMAWAYRRAGLWHRPRPGTRWGLTQHGFGCYANATLEEGLPYSPALLRHMRGLEKSVVARADWVICPTEDSRQQLARDLGWLQPLPRWHAVPHAKPVLNLPSRAQARQALGLVDGQTMVLAVGRINPVKRMQHIVQAVAALPWPLPAALAAAPLASFPFASSPFPPSTLAPLPPSPSPLRLVLLAAAGDEAELRRAAAQAPQLDLQILLAEDVAPYLAAADLYVSAARNESFGLANLEAMVAGLPMVCTAVGGVPEVTGGAAWLVPGGEADLVARLTQALQALLANSAQRQALAAAARRRGAAWPTADRIAERYEQVYLAAH